MFTGADKWSSSYAFSIVQPRLAWFGIIHKTDRSDRKMCKKKRFRRLLRVENLTLLNEWEWSILSLEKTLEKETKMYEKLN